LDQTITFGSLSDKTFGDPPFTLSASASSGLPVTFTVDAGPGSISGGSSLALTAAGQITIRASQAGNATYNPAPDVSRSFDVAKASQNITFNALPNRSIGEAPFSVSGSASSGLPLSFTISSGPATNSANTVFVTNVGSITVRASQSGNSNYVAAPDVNRSFIVYAPPALNADLMGTNFVLRWPTNVNGYVLESATILTNPIAWSAVLPSPVVLGGMNTVTNVRGNGDRFYRLRK